MKLVLIPAGTFKMGSPDNEENRLDSEHQHEVEITRPYFLGIYEVTQKQYRDVMGNNPSAFCARGASSSYKGPRRYRTYALAAKGLDTDDFPVEEVTWKEAVEFCKRLSALPEEKAAGREYRLPSEAEWEYACRAGASSYQLFHYGNSLSSVQANFNGNYPWGAPKGPDLERTTKVGSYPPNAFGLYDMHGNVWEWCADWFDQDYYTTSPRRDPPGPFEGSGKVIRGGSWNNGSWHCRSARRNAMSTNWDSRSESIGFRVALVASEEKR